jgi:hypothetical protein
MSRADDDDWDGDQEGGGRDELGAQDEGSESAAASRTSLPGTFLIVCGVLNLFAVLYMVANTAFTATRSAEEIAQQQELSQDLMVKLFPQAKEEIQKEKDKQQKTPEQVKTMAMGVNIGVLLAWLAATVLPILAGVRMRQLRSYGLSVTGAVVAAAPCISPMSCLCGLGLGVGIWALVVLLNPAVKSAFR